MDHSRTLRPKVPAVLRHNTQPATDALGDESAATVGRSGSPLFHKEIAWQGIVASYRRRRERKGGGKASQGDPQNRNQGGDGGGETAWVGVVAQGCVCNGKRQLLISMCAQFRSRDFVISNLGPGRSVQCSVLTSTGKAKRQLGICR